MIYIFLLKVMIFFLLHWEEEGLSHNCLLLDPALLCLITARLKAKTNVKKRKILIMICLMANIIQALFLQNSYMIIIVICYFWPSTNKLAFWIYNIYYLFLLQIAVHNRMQMCILLNFINFLDIVIFLI